MKRLSLIILLIAVTLMMVNGCNKNESNRISQQPSKQFVFSKGHVLMVFPEGDYFGDFNKHFKSLCGSKIQRQPDTTLTLENIVADFKGAGFVFEETITVDFRDENDNYVSQKGDLFVIIVGDDSKLIVFDNDELKSVNKIKAEKFSDLVDEVISKNMGFLN